MDDMNDFERQLAAKIGRMAGPEPHFNALEIARSAATQSPMWRFQSMISAAKFVVAGAIVALFGGFLLAGVLTQPNEGEVPAAVTDSPAPVTTPDLLPGVDLVTEEVEPGVYRVLSDGVRELAAPRGEGSFTVFDLVVGHDGGVWRVGPDDEVFRLGEPMTRQWPEEPRLIGDEDIEIAADGTIWFANEWRPQFVSPSYRVMSSEGSAWSDAYAMLTASDVEIGPGGSVWAHGEGLVHLLEPDGSSAWPAPGGVGVASQFFVTADGTKWITSTTTPAIWRDDSDWLSEEASWETVLLGFVEPGQLSISAQRTVTAIGADGTLWMFMELDEPDGSILARLDVDGWSSWAEAAGVPEAIGTGGFGGGSLAVAPDDSVWLAAGAPSGSVHAGCSQRVSRFDGATWTDYLDGLCIHAVDVADDGTAWVRAGTTGYNAEIYAITSGGARKAD